MQPLAPQVTQVESSIPKHVGLGLRHPHYAHVLEQNPDIAWFEVHPENFFAKGGAALHILERVREHYPLSLHGVGLSLGSATALDRTHLQKLKVLVDRFEPGLVSEHVSWSNTHGMVANDLLPVPYTKEALAHLASNIQQTQDYLGRQILVENPSSYLSFKQDEMPEHVFMLDVAKKAGCKLLLDVNNIYVASKNHGFDPYAYIDAIDGALVGEIHLAGHSSQQVDGGTILIDTHSAPVIDSVWALYAHAIKHIGIKPTLIEWDNDIPEFSVLEAEAKKAEKMLHGD